jgi:hypothetical protein
MVQKHEMLADFEQLTYSPEMLRSAWDKIADTFKLLIAAGWTTNDVLELINYIRTTDYASQLFPGSSLGTLLVSKPRNARLNYQQTLAVKVDDAKTKVILKYSDWDTIDKREDWEKAVIWTTECSGEKLREKFDEFIVWNKNWH